MSKYFETWACIKNGETGEVYLKENNMYILMIECCFVQALKAILSNSRLAGINQKSDRAPSR